MTRPSISTSTGTHLRTRVGAILRAIAAVVAMLVLVVGVPALLVRLIGNPVPASWSWQEPLTNDAVLGVVAVLAWVVWAQLVLCLIVEVAAELRIAAGRSAEWMSRVPGTFGGQQALARNLVQAVVAVGIGSAAIAAPPTSWQAPADAATSTPTQRAEVVTIHPPEQALTETSAQASTASRPLPMQKHMQTQTQSQPQAQAHAQGSGTARAVSPPPGAPATRARRTSTAASSTVNVAKGDSLWVIAERHLGRGERWRQIAELNQGRTMPDGHSFHDAITLQPGWTLLVPNDKPHDKSRDKLRGTAPASVEDYGREHRLDSEQAKVTVEPGDTLWALAENAYGDGEDWHHIYAANRAQIDDPDLIYPGQQLDMPAARADDPPVHQVPGHRTAQPDAKPSPAPPASTSPSRPPPSPTAAQRTDGSRSASTRSTQSNHTDASGESAHKQPAGPDDETVGTGLRALFGGGGLLAAGLLAALLARRRHQFRHRRSGHTITATPPGLVDAERSIRSHGSVGGQSARFLDQALRNLATRARQGKFEMPDVVAARLTTDSVELVLANPHDDAPAPWASSQNGGRWTLRRDADLGGADEALAPYPTLVAVGLDPDGATWLIDLEAAGIVQLTGEERACLDLARFVAAELAINTWSDSVEVQVAGLAHELIPLNPSRLEKADDLDLDRLTKAARRVREATQATGQDVLAGRVDGRGGDTWMPTILIANASTRHTPAPGAVADLGDELSLTTGRNAVAFLATDLEPQPGALLLTLNPEGQLETPWSRALNPNRLSIEEARDLGELFASTQDDSNEASGETSDENVGSDSGKPIPASRGRAAYDHFSDAAGALRADLTAPRIGDHDPRSLLPDPDETYLTAAATTAEDLKALAPTVSEATSKRALAADPDLDADLTEWLSPVLRRPRLRLLGPVELQVGGDRPYDVKQRPAYYIEMVAYLSTRPLGVSPAQMAEAFDVQTNTLHSRITTLRRWLGEDDAHGTLYLPESTLSDAGRARGVPVYELDGILCDADLFRRLRLRGQARGHDGIADLITALGLVVGVPFDQQREAGYGWLAETPEDHHLTAAIIDVAHLVATHALAHGDAQLAMWAAEKAITAAPSDDKPRLDLARAKSAMGNAEEADEYVKEQILKRSDDKSPPPPPTARTHEVLKQVKARPGDRTSRGRGRSQN